MAAASNSLKSGSVAFTRWVTDEDDEKFPDALAGEEPVSQ